MKYCPKCKRLYNDNDEVCSECKTRLTDITDNLTAVYLLSASGFELQRIKAAFEDSGIPCECSAKKHSYSADAVTGYDSAEYDILVPFSAYERAYDTCVGIGAIKLENEEILDEPVEYKEEYQQMSKKKRVTVKVVSAFLFLLLVAAVIYGTDFITGIIKNLFI